MATLVKEKRREKKKTKEKETLKLCDDSDELQTKNTITTESNLEIKEFSVKIEGNTEKADVLDESRDSMRVGNLVDTKTSSISTCTSELETSSAKINLHVSNEPEHPVKAYNETNFVINQEIIPAANVECLTSSPDPDYKELNRKLAVLDVSNIISLKEEGATDTLKDLRLHSMPDVEQISETDTVLVPSTSQSHQNVLPSAPMLEEQIMPYTAKQEVVTQIVKPKIKGMPIEMVLERSEGGRIKLLSEKEEAAVEAGPVSNSEHPLVDLLSTFRSSLIAVERERNLLTCGFVEEEKSWAALWKVEKRHVDITESCQCGANIYLKASYEHAELMRERLPVARLRLESLLRDVQDSYCHYQHEALLAYCQIEDLISETIKGSKPIIREALSLVLQTLRMSDSAPVALASALQRWACALTEALADATDVTQLLFVIHHLFRQTRSVRWAARAVRLRVDDYIAANRVIALLDVLLTRPKPRLDTALECTEETEEAWEEVDRHGSGGAVSDGTLRERDLLALFYAFPLRDTIAKLLQFTHADIREAKPHEWVTRQYSGTMLEACCGVRVLLCTLRRAVRVHTQYARLHAALRALANKALVSLAALHLHTRSFYLAELKDSIIANLETTFAEGLGLFGQEELYSVPTTLLSSSTALEYCRALIDTLHDKSSVRIESISAEIPVLPCAVRVHIVSQAAIDRFDDHCLAESVLTFLFQTGIKRKTPVCLGKCEPAACEWLPRLLAVHFYLYPLALHMTADLNILEPVEPSALKSLSIGNWRPNVGELRSVLDDWEQRCTQLMQHLLLELDYNPHTGVSYECQLTIGSWLCSWARTSAPASAEWCWQVLRRLRVHRVYWGPPIDAPPPHTEPVDLFSKAYALCSTSWGHSIPMICSEGVSVLCVLAATRPRDATYCAAPVMALMSHSPESVSLTPKFTELFSTLLSCRPSLVLRALGRGGDTGPELLLRITLEQIQNQTWFWIERGALLRVWLHALWNLSLGGTARGVLDTAAAACRHWPLLDSHAVSLLQTENYKEYVSDAVSHAALAPLLCECVLRAAHASCTRTHAYALLLRALANQRANSHRIHVDNALQQAGGTLSSEELVVYQSAKAALVAPLHHPSQLMLWRLFMHLYLERPPDNVQEPSAPIGPLFYSGIIKSRTLVHIKKCLQDTATYHHNEAATLKDVQQRTPSVSTPTKPKRTTRTVDDTIFPTLSIIDFTGEPSDSGTESDFTDEEDERRTRETGKIVDSPEKKKRERYNLMCYHEGAEKMVREYARWLEEGERVRAEPHHADIARFISEQALEAGWQDLVSRSRPPLDLESPTGTIATFTSASSETAPSTPFDIAVQTILKIKDRSRKRPRRTVLKSPIGDVDTRSKITFVTMFDKHLQDLEILAKEWCAEVGRVSALDNTLWELVSALRVQRALPPVKKQCSNKCKPIQICIPAQEWCVSTGAERGIKENRISARAAVRRLSRARPHAVHSVATLHSLVRRIDSTDAGVRVLELVWRVSSACACAACPPVNSALSSLANLIAQRWVCHDGRACAQLMSRWGRHSANLLQQALCSMLVVPRRLPLAEYPILYTVLLQAELPDHLLFSCLSKFQLCRWSETAGTGPRRELLDALTRAVQRWGPLPEPSHYVVLEITGVHTRALLDPREICEYVVRATRATVACTLPPSHWTHVSQAINRCASKVPYEKLCNLFRELGVLWWEARTDPDRVNGIIEYAAYASYLATLLQSLQQAYVIVILKLRFTPDRVGKCIWLALQESWGAWISPHPTAPPLLPSTANREAYTPLLNNFVSAIIQITEDCPGSEVAVLQQVWGWVIQVYLSVYNGGSPESRVQMSALLAQLGRLPWNRHQWCTGKCLQPALQISDINDKEMTSWCCRAWSSILAETWMREEDERDIGERTAPRLASLLYLFTGTTLPHAIQTFEEATKLPWWRLPGPALDEALERFFAVHHNPAQPYHTIPQFDVIMHASGLRMRPEAVQQYVRCADARTKRERSVSQWVRCACAPVLAAHASAHSTIILNTLTDLVPFLEGSEGEIEELLGRALVIMCIEPAATSALPVWVQWVRKTDVRMIRGCVSAAGGLTTLEYFAQLADASVKAFIDHKDGGGWEEVMLRWRKCPWREASPFVVRTRLHAAYGVLLGHAHAQYYDHMNEALLALSAANLLFNENDAIVALWICVSMRACVRATHGACATAARALLCAWATPPARSLLRVVSLQSQAPSPTPRHRLLCRFAQWILDPTEANAREYQTACAAVPGSSPGDVSAPAATPDPGRLVRLAMRLYPLQEKYFAMELKMASRTTDT